MLEDLRLGVVDAVFVDIYALADYTPLIKKKALKMKSLINTHTGYGLVLSGPSQVLKPDIESMIFSKKKLMDQYVKSIEEFMPVNLTICFLIAILKITWSKEGILIFRITVDFFLEVEYV